MAILPDDTKNGLRRSLQSRQKEAIQLSQQADDHIERLLIRRFERLISVRRFVMLWVGLFVLLIFATIMQIRWLSAYYQRLVPVAGGVYAEGLVGSFTNANPIYATGTADAAVSRLVFSGLFRFDDNNNLVGDLASGYRLNKDQTIYTINLRPGIKWHDSQPFTADDVVYTYETIQNPAALSPLLSSWQDIRVKKINPLKVEFILPNPLSSFPYSLTNGILPEHLLKNVPLEQLRTANFNINPVGTGPFEWKFVEVSGATTDDRQQRISLAEYPRYWAGRPKLDGINLNVFADDQHMISAFEKKQINAMSGLELVPEELKKDRSVEVYNTSLTSAVMAFFNNSRAKLNDTQIRQALVRGVDRSRLQDISPYAVKLVDEPLLRGQLGYSSHLSELPYSPSAADRDLHQAGWKLGAGNIRFNNGQPLQLQMAAQDTKQYTQIAQFLQDEWAKIGVKINVHYYNSDDLQAEVIASHDYDILLYGITLGVDPDEFAYWDSSQASLASQGHLNLSEYRSKTADLALEGARTRSDPSIRAAKYKAFLAAWRQDAPALALYQPNFLYISRGPVFGYGRKAYNSGVDRFYNIGEWAIRQKRQTL